MLVCCLLIYSCSAWVRGDLKKKTPDSVEWDQEQREEKQTLSSTDLSCKQALTPLFIYPDMWGLIHGTFDLYFEGWGHLSHSLSTALVPAAINRMKDCPWQWLN